MLRFEDELEQDVIGFGQRMNTKSEGPIPPRPTMQTEIVQLNAEQSRIFQSLRDDKLGFKYLDSISANGNGN